MWSQIQIHAPVLIAAVLSGSLIYHGGRAIFDREQRVQYLLDTISPVVTDMKITSAKVLGGNLYIEVRGEKVRECEKFLSINAVYGGQHAVVRFLDDKNIDGTFQPPDSNPVGTHDFGIWEVEPYVPNQELEIYTVHKCGQAYVKTDIGVFKPDDYLKGSQ